MCKTNPKRTPNEPRKRAVSGKTNWAFGGGSLAERIEEASHGLLDHSGVRERSPPFTPARCVARPPECRGALDVDAGRIRAASVVKKSGLKGLLIADRTPEMACQPPRHAFTAHDLGFIRAALRQLERDL